MIPSRRGSYLLQHMSVPRYLQEVERYLQVSASVMIFDSSVVEGRREERGKGRTGMGEGSLSLRTSSRRASSILWQPRFELSSQSDCREVDCSGTSLTLVVNNYKAFLFGWYMCRSNLSTVPSCGVIGLVWGDLPRW